MRTTAPRRFKPPVCTQFDTGNPLLANLGCCLDFNEGAGPAHDATGNGNTGTINGGVTWAQNGNWGTCLGFNGSSGYLTFPAATTGITGATPGATISAWMRPTQTGTAAAIAANVASSTVDGNWYLRYTATGALSLRAYYAAGTFATATTTATYTDNTWYHVVAVISQPTLYIYVNGVQAASTAFGETWTAAAGLWVGCQAGSGLSASQFWQGQLDGFRFWSRALTATEVSQLYANYWQIYVPPLPVAWWSPARAGGSTYWRGGGSTLWPVRRPVDAALVAEFYN